MADIRHHLTSRIELNDLAELKLHWRVSMQSLLIRAGAIGRLTKTQSTRLWKQISFHGYKTREPNAFTLEPHTLLPETIRVHVEDLEFSLENLCTLLRLEAEEVRALYKPDGAPAPGQPPRLRLVAQVASAASRDRRAGYPQPRLLIATPTVTFGTQGRHIPRPPSRT